MGRLRSVVKQQGLRFVAVGQAEDAERYVGAAGKAIEIQCGKFTIVVDPGVDVGLLDQIIRLMEARVC